MRVLAFDSGAERMGWGSVGKHESGRPYYHISDILRLPRGNKAFQKYRMDLEEELCNSIPALIDLTEPDEIVTETVPAVGFNNSTQAYLANVAITTVHAVAIIRGLPVYQIGANTVKKDIAIGGKTKPRVRNGVIQLLPELEHRKSSWVKEFDEPDAIAIGLAHLGFSNSTVTRK